MTAKAHPAPGPSGRNRSAYGGIDVGAERKGLHVAIVDATGALRTAEQGLSPFRAAEVLMAAGVALVGVDAPCTAAPPGARSREDERELVRSGLCRIRWTPDEPEIEANPAYYGWVLNGFRAYAALAAAGVPAVEVFPTAAWSVWHGPRAGRSRAAWSTEALAALGVRGVPPRTSQDDRDAIAAAACARCADVPGAARSFGAIVVPVRRPPWSPHAPSSSG